MCITLTHSYNLLQQSELEPLMRFSGQRVDFSFIGLSIFFSVSGYLVAKSTITSPSFKNYVWKRFLRIQPLLIVVCMLSIFILGPLFTSLNIREYFIYTETYSYFRNILPVFGIQFSLPGVFLNNPAESGVNGSLWTLVTEERLYILLAFLFLFRQKMKFLQLLTRRLPRVAISQQFSLTSKLSKTVYRQMQTALLLHCKRFTCLPMTFRIQRCK